MGRGPGGGGGCGACRERFDFLKLRPGRSPGWVYDRRFRATTVPPIALTLSPPGQPSERTSLAGAPRFISCFECSGARSSYGGRKKRGLVADPAQRAPELAQGLIRKDAEEVRPDRRRLRERAKPSLEEPKRLRT